MFKKKIYCFFYLASKLVVYVTKYAFAYWLYLFIISFSIC